MDAQELNSGCIAAVVQCPQAPSWINIEDCPKTLYKAYKFWTDDNNNPLAATLWDSGYIDEAPDRVIEFFDNADSVIEKALTKFMDLENRYAL